MASNNIDVVDNVVRDMLDAMRNAHLQMVLGNPTRALEYLRDAATAHTQMASLFHGDPANEAMAGRILYDVIGQRMESLEELASDSLIRRKPMDEIVAFVARPLGPNRTRD